MCRRTCCSGKDDPDARTLHGRRCRSLSPPYDIVLGAQRQPVHIGLQRSQSAESAREKEVITGAIHAKSRYPRNSGGVGRSEELDSCIERTRLDHTECQRIKGIVLEEEERRICAKYPLQLSEPRRLAGGIDVMKHAAGEADIEARIA